jgi:hypothetical protein
VSGTSHRHCNSVQGWVCDSGPFNNRYGNRAKSKKQLVDRIEAVWKSWNENGAVQESTGARNELRMLWGDNPASLEADKKIAQKQKEIEAQRAAYIAREGAEKILRDAGPAMLEALKYVDRVLRSNNWDRADYHTGGPTMAVHVRAAIKKAETGE